MESPILMQWLIRIHYIPCIFLHEYLFISYYKKRIKYNFTYKRGVLYVPGNYLTFYTIYVFFSPACTGLVYLLYTCRIGNLVTWTDVLDLTIVIFDTIIISLISNILESYFTITQETTEYIILWMIFNMEY